MPFEPVDHAGLGGAELDPVARLGLQRQEERLAAAQRLVGQLLAAAELQLEGELADQGRMVAAIAPQRHVAHRRHAVAEIEHADVLQHFLDDGAADELGALVLLPRDRLQRRQRLGDALHRHAIAHDRAFHVELDIVRIEHAHAAQPVLERQGLGLELDAVVAGDVRPHVELGRLLRIGVADT